MTEDKSLYGTLPSNLVYYKESPIRKLVWYTPYQSKHLSFTDDLEIQSGKYGVPGLVFFTDNNNMRLYAYKQWKGLHTELFYAPFPNVKEDVCMGSASEILKKNRNKRFIDYINYVETVFWESRFTHNHASIKKRNYISFMNQMKDSNKPFPKEALVPFNKTLADVISKNS